MINKIFGYFKSHKLLTILLLLFFIIRLLYLDQINLLHDEKDIALTGYFLAKSLKSLSGIFLPLNFIDVSVGSPFLSFYYSALWWIILPFKSVFFARFPYVFITSFLIFIVYEFILQITRDKNISTITAIIFCFSPWIFHTTRFTLDIPLGLVFLLLAMILYLRKKRFYSYLLFFLAFNSYQGFRILIPFLLIYLELFFYINKQSLQKFIKNNLLNIIFIAFLIVFSFTIDSKITKDRLDNIVFFNQQNLAHQVDFKRNTSIAPNILKKAFNNKATETINYLLNNFIQGQDLSYLFKQGDPSAINGSTSAGQFFLPFLLFYYLGFVNIGKRLKKEDFYIFVLSFIALIPSLISVNGVSFSFRSILSGLGFSYILSLGILFSFGIYKKIKSKYKVLIAFIFVFIILININYFIYNYYFRRPIAISELFNENERQIAKYLNENANNKYAIYHNSPKEIFMSYIFFNNTDIDMKKAQLQFKKGQPFIWNNFSFMNCNNKINYKNIKNAIVSEYCLDKKVYEYLNDESNKKIEHKIPYSDISEKTAYFVFK